MFLLCVSLLHLPLDEKIVVYPSSAILFMLRSDRFSPGSTSASLAALVNVLNGSLVRRDVFSLALLGR